MHQVTCFRPSESLAVMWLEENIPTWLKLSVLQVPLVVRFHNRLKHQRILYKYIEILHKEERMTMTIRKKDYFTPSVKMRARFRLDSCGMPVKFERGEKSNLH